MKKNTQQRIGVLALVLLTSVSSATNGFASKGDLKTLELAETLKLVGSGQSTFESLLLNKLAPVTLVEEVRQPQKTWRQRACEGLSALAKKVSPWAKSAGSYAYHGFTEYAIPGTVSLASLTYNYGVPLAKSALFDCVLPLGKVTGQALLNSPQAFQDGYTRAKADTTAYQQQGYKPLASFALVTLLHPTCWLGNQIFSKKTQETSYVNLHNLAGLCYKGAKEGTTIAANADWNARGAKFLVPVVGGGTAYLSLLLTGAATSAIATLGDLAASKFGGYLPTPQMAQAA